MKTEFIESKILEILLCVLILFLFFPSKMMVIDWVYGRSRTNLKIIKMNEDFLR